MADPTRERALEPLSERSLLRVPTRTQALMIWLSSGALTFFVSGIVTLAASAIALRLGYEPDIVEDIFRSPLFVHPTWVALSTLPVQLTLLGCVVFWVYWLRPSLRVTLPLFLPRAPAVVGSLLLVAGVWPIADLVAELTYRWIGPEVTLGEMLAVAAKRANGPQMALLLIVLSVFPAVGEEAMFRGLLTAPFRSAAGAVLVPAVLFGLIHFDPVAIAGTTVLGIAFGVTRIYTGSLVAPMLAHGLYNATVLSLARSGEVTHRIQVWPLVAGIVLAGLGWFLLHRERNRARVAA